MDNRDKKRGRQNYSTTNKGQSTVNYRQSLAFNRPYLSHNDHCDWWLFQEIFFIILEAAVCRFLWNRCVLESSVLESLFNKVIGLMACKFISTASQKKLQHRLSLWKLWNFYSFFYGAPLVAAFVSLIK